MGSVVKMDYPPSVSLCKYINTKMETIVAIYNSLPLENNDIHISIMQILLVYGYFLSVKIIIYKII